ncbi:hypothetical protein IU421_14715 [Nocardia cyriacigeorgica]|uniref:hypothetical protein n=1 Tax=Nocardia cyriacigeorgica TaxID=135487 RepID=UPI0018936D2A|nr:hypothetical protein [Nocardia cyriacigeorgica]MBF6515522.1 hypothetical protein [Nocardia cyriacigeorgica]
MSWKDEAGATHWGDDNSKAYKKHLQAKADAKPTEVKPIGAKPAEVKPAVVAPAVEVEAKRK